MFRPIAAALLCLAAAAGCADGPALPDRTEAEAELRRASAAFDRAVVTANAADLNEILADDYSYVTAEGELRDKPTQIATITSGQLQVMSAGSEDVTIRWIGDDDALLIGRFPARIRSGDEEVTINARHSTIWTRDDGRWRLRHQHASLIPQRR
jgi:uncharacterized protein (TIGR02246 family)